MHSTIKTDAVIDELTTQSITRVRQLMAQADRARGRQEKASRKRVARLMRDPVAIEATITMTDEVMRIAAVKSASHIFRRAAHQASIKGFGPIDGIGLKILGLISFVLPSTAVKMVHQRVRALSRDLILTSENEKLAKHLAARKGIGKIGRAHV